MLSAEDRKFVQKAPMQRFQVPLPAVPQTEPGRSWKLERQSTCGRLLHMSSRRPQQTRTQLSAPAHVFNREAGAKKLLLAASSSVNQPVDNFMAYEATGLRRSRHID